MNRISKILVMISALFALAASAAIFDTLDSVDTLQKVAAKNQENTGRSPAGTVSESKPEADQVKPVETTEKDSVKKSEK